MLKVRQALLADGANSAIETDELLRNLGRFPIPVLPYGLLNELQRRGDAIHDPLVEFVGQAVDRIRDGLSSDPESAFFAVALLVLIATYEDRALIESLLTLPDQPLGLLASDLVTDGLPQLVAKFFANRSASEVIDWIDRLADHPQLEDMNSCTLYRAIALAVTTGHLNRDTAIDFFVSRLNKLAGRQYDLQSALIICELIDLSAQSLKEVDAVVRECFARNQIYDDYVGLSSWETASTRKNIRSDSESWLNTADELRHWRFDFESDDLDPVDAKFRINDQVDRPRRLQESSVAGLIDQLRQSTDTSFPREAVSTIDNNFADAYHSIIDLIRSEVVRYHRDSESWSGNGAYLGLVLTIVNQMPLPIDLLEAILQLPGVARDKIFGDQFHLIVRTIALTPLHQHDFVDQWIWDSDRPGPDRREMVDFYVLACEYGTLAREVAMDTLAVGLKRALLEEPTLAAPYAENLALLTPTKYSRILEEAFNRDDLDWFIPLEDLRRMARDADFAAAQVRQHRIGRRLAKEIISEGVMFNEDALEEKPTKPTRIPPLDQRSQTIPEVLPTKTIRSEVRTPRNAPCPCGSGKKYKHCCLKD